MLQDFLKSFESTDLSKIPLKELVQLEKTLSFYEATTPLRFYRNKINEEFIRRKSKYLRFEVHEINTGYKPEDWECDDLSPEQKNKLKKRNAGWDQNYGWKFHLDVVPNRNHSVTREISDFLLDLGVWHKIAHGGDNGKGMTVYVGSYEDTCKLAHIIQERFGNKIFKPTVYTDQVVQEYPFERTVYGRFCLNTDAKYPYKEIVGISPWLCANTYVKTINKAVSLGEVSPNNADFFKSGSTQSETDKKLSAYCSHKLYVAVFGQYYYGTSLKQFEDKFFENKIPSRGTKKRQNWDEIAKVFIEETKEYRNFEILGEDAQKYTPLDFSNIKPVNNIRAKWKQNKTYPQESIAENIIAKWRN